MSTAAKAISDVIHEVLPQDLMVTATPRHVASVLAAATAVSMIAAEFRRRTSVTLPSAVDSAYTQNFSKGIGIAVAIVLSVVSAAILVFEPAAADTMAVWTGFAALVGACSVLPATHNELLELETKSVHRLYWLPVLFAGSLFAVMFFSVPR